MNWNVPWDRERVGIFIALESVTWVWFFCISSSDCTYSSFHFLSQRQRFFDLRLSVIGRTPRCFVVGFSPIWNHSLDDCPAGRHWISGHVHDQRPHDHINVPHGKYSSLCTERVHDRISASLLRNSSLAISRWNTHENNSRQKNVVGRNMYHAQRHSTRLRVMMRDIFFDMIDFLSKHEDRRSLGCCVTGYMTTPAPWYATHGDSLHRHHSEHSSSRLELCQTSGRHTYHGYYLHWVISS